MGGLVRPLLVVAAIAVNVIPGIGQVLSAAIITAITTAGITAAIGMAASMLGPKKAGTSGVQESRGVINDSAAASRKWVFGTTLFALDLRYEEWVKSSDDAPTDDLLFRVFILASHKVQSIDEFWLDKELAWTKSGGDVAKFAVDMILTEREEGNAGNVVLITRSTKYGANNRYTGMAYAVVRFRTTYDEDHQSIFAGHFPNKMVFKGRGSPVFDPRAGQSATNQATWAFDTGAGQGDNPALQLLTYLIGYRINGTLVLGMGIPVARIDLPSFIAAANLCDEMVTKSGGGTEKRYRSAGIFSESDEPTFVFQTLCNSMNAVLRDTGGKFTLAVLNNDLGAPVLTLNDSDVISEFEWQQTPPLDQCFNEIRGRFSPNVGDRPDMESYPAVTIASPDGIPRVYNLDLPCVYSVSQAQRLAKQQLQRNLVRGKFQCDLGPRGYILQLGDPVNFTFSMLGWASKPFRVVEITYTQMGRVSVVLQEENASIYAWDASDAPPVTLIAPNVYDPKTSQVLQNLAKLTTIDPQASAGDNLVRNGWLQMNVSDPLLTPHITLTNLTRTDATATVPAPPKPAGAVKAWVAADEPEAATAEMAMAEVSTEIRGTTPFYIGAFCYAEFVSGVASVTFTIKVDWYQGGAFLSTDSQELVVPASASSINYQFLEMAKQPPANATGAKAYLTVGSHASHRVRVTGLRVSKNQSGASRSAEIKGPSTLRAAADSGGTLTGSSPYAQGLYTFTDNGVTVTSGVTWSKVDPSGITTTLVDNGNGTAYLNLTGPFPSRMATVRITAARAGLPDKTFDVTFYRDDAPPSTGGGGGGGSGGTSESQTGTFTTYSGTTAVVISTTLDITTGSLGKAVLTASLNTDFVNTASPNGYTAPRFQFQRETSPGTWAAVGTYFESSPLIVSSGEYTNGTASTSQEITGLGASSSQKFRLTAWNLGGTRTSSQVTTSGQIGAQGG